MKRLLFLLLLLPVLAVPTFADVIGPGEMLLRSGALPAALVLTIVVFTALIIRKKNKKK